MTADTFDSIQIVRPGLARSYLELLKAQPGRPLAMFAPRRVGKTFFLDHDLGPQARKAGWVPVYADLWLQRDDPLEAITHALEEALDEALVPRTSAGRLAKTTVRKIGLAGASLDLGDSPARRALPAKVELRLDALIVRLHEACGKPVLLMLDEVQSLAGVVEGDKKLGSLRAVLHKRREQVHAVFTGSSQEDLARMVSLAGAPMYQFAQLIDFPTLGDDFLQALADHYAKVHPGRPLPMDDLRRMFDRLGRRPRLMRDLVKCMSAEGTTDVDQGLRLLLGNEQHITGWASVLSHFDAPVQAIAIAVARGIAPLSAEAAQLVQSLSGSAVTPGKQRVAVEQLRKAGVLGKGRPIAFTDPLMADFLRDKSLRELGRLMA